MTIPFESASELARIRHIRHGFFTRQGGVSGKFYRSLNCGVGSSDRQDHVAENRRRVSESMGVEADRLIGVYQIHSAVTVEIDEEVDSENRPEADGMVSTTPGLALGILTADCVPVLFADQRKPVIGAAHAGWGGAISGILPTTVCAMEKKGSKRANIVAAIGPTIAQQSYEVGSEYRERFLAKDKSNDRYFIKGVREGHYQFDLPGFVHDQLLDLGLGTVENLALDTYSNADRFFSYRRATHLGEADYGRQISAIALC
jgi:YfiH family protein